METRTASPSPLAPPPVGAVAITLVDADSRRRAAIAHCLTHGGIHVEPFESAGELIAARAQAGAVLAHDDGLVVAMLSRKLAESGDWLPIIAFAADPTPAAIVAAIHDGAVDYLSWPFDAAVLVTALERTSDRAGMLEAARRREATARLRIERLSRRERQVLSGVASGLSNRLIAERLAISPRTVEIHRANMLAKMGAPRTSDAIRIAVEASLSGI